MLQNTLMLLLYIILIFYSLNRITNWVRQAFSFSINKRRTINITLSVLFIIACSTIMIWMLFPKNDFSISIIRCGNYWLGFFIQFVPALLIADLLLLIIKKVRRKQGAGPVTPRFFRIYGIAVFSIVAALTVIGCVNARRIQTVNYDITIDKKSAAVSDLNVVLIADTHMGYSIGCSQIQKMVDKINAVNPDLVVFAGDIFDNNFDSLEDPEQLAEIYRQINSKYGIYAVFGNHDVMADLVGGFTVGGSRLRDPRMEQFLKDSNITIMLDDVTTIADDSIYLIGRIDGEETGDGNERKSIEELTKDLDPSKPVFVINHEPVELESYDNCQVSVLFSGHTHAGQTFPLNVLMPLAWKNAHGCIKVGSMYSLVTSGIGIYGPYMRTFSDAEIMDIHIHLE